jgi:glycogen operon protein
MNEFRDLVKALHRAGIRVILDVVFNHTDEGTNGGPHSFRGIDNADVLSARPEQSRRLRELAASATRSTRIIRFRRSSSSIACGTGRRCTSMASGSTRARSSRAGRRHAAGPSPGDRQIELEDALADTKLIAEAWDAAGLYQVGHFPGDRWAEWNGLYRDDVRRFVRVIRA